jgi:hypothetical protein
LPDCNIFFQYKNEIIFLVFDFATPHIKKIANATRLKIDYLKGLIIYDDTLILFYVLNDLYHFVPWVLYILRIIWANDLHYETLWF